MRITIELNSAKDIILPIQYSHIVQGFLYKNLSDRDYSTFIHHEGYRHDRRQFKMFTFSKILGQFQLNRREGMITFKPPVRIIVSSAVEQFISDLAETLIKSELCFLGNNPVEIKSIGVERNFEFTNPVQIKMLSPVVAYSTIMKDEKKYTEYYSPWQPRFIEIAQSNLLAKYSILYGETPANDEFKIIPNGNQEQKFKAVMNYKGTVIVGYSGIYWLKGNPDLIKVAYDAGLGSKNSQGFGCFEVVG